MSHQANADDGTADDELEFPSAGMKGYLGWDVGAWHCQRGPSRDALALVVENGGSIALHGEPWRGNLLDTFNEGGGGGFLLRALLKKLNAHDQPWSDLTLAIDTPLGVCGKTRLNSHVFPSLELIALCSGWISAVQRLRPADFSDSGPWGLSGDRRLATPLGNQPLMPPSLPV